MSMILERCTGMARTRAIPALLLFCTVAFAGKLHAAPYVPAQDDEIVADLPTSVSPNARRAMALHKLLQRAPDSLELALQAAGKDMEVARAQADPRFGGYAESALAPWWSLPDPPVQVLLLRATIRQNRHDFSGALDDLARVLRERPQDGQAYLTRATIRQVRGNYAEASDDCRALARLTDGIAARACLDSVGSVSGKAEESFADLRDAMATQGAGGDKGVESWCLTLLAEMSERLGRPDLAEQYFKRALALGLSDSYLLGAYADFLLDRHRPGEVIALLGSQTRNDPLLLRLALAEQQSGAASLSTHIEDLSQRFADARARGDGVHRREEARFALFLLQKPAEALRLAQENWAIQREPADVRIFLQAASAANPAAAKPVVAWIAEKHFQDTAIEAMVEQLSRGRS
jgi:tetratricopeptide (TPR) repeat protein